MKTIKLISMYCVIVSIMYGLNYPLLLFFKVFIIIFFIFLRNQKTPDINYNFKFNRSREILGLILTNSMALAKIYFI